MYDQTGSLEDSDELAGEQFDSLYKYYRGLYRKVSFITQHLVSSMISSLPGGDHKICWLQLPHCCFSRWCG